MYVANFMVLHLYVAWHCNVGWYCHCQDCGVKNFLDNVTKAFLQILEERKKLKSGIQAGPQCVARGYSKPVGLNYAGE